MKTSLEIKAFKNELRNYRFYEKRINSCKQQLDWCYSQLGGSARSPQFDAIPGEHNNFKSDEQLDREYRIREEIESWEDKIARTRIKLNDIDEILNKVENDNENGLFLRKAMFDIYAKGRSSRRVAELNNYSQSWLLDMINRALKKALD